MLPEVSSKILLYNYIPWTCICRQSFQMRSPSVVSQKKLSKKELLRLASQRLNKPIPKSETGEGDGPIQEDAFEFFSNEERSSKFVEQLRRFVSAKIFEILNSVNEE